MAARYAVSLMALLGSVAAQGYSNSSSSAVSVTSSAPGATYTDGAEPTVAGVKFLIQTDTAYQGTILTLSRKRQSNADINSCLNTCAASTDCEGAAFVSDTMSCIYYSTVDADTATNAPGTDFALVQSRASASSTSSVFNGTTPATPQRTTGLTHSSSNYGNSTRAPGSATRSSRASITGGASASRTSSGSASSTSSTAPVSTPSGLISIDGVQFLIEINITYSGITIDFEILAKRDGYTLEQCLSTCAAETSCAGTAFDNGECTFYTSITSGSQRVDVGNTFGTVVNRAANGTTPTNGTTPASNVTAESLICPAYNGAVITSSVDVSFAVSCSRFLIGTTFDISPELMKRQAIDTGLPQTLSNCIDLCSLSESCVGTTFDIAREECSYYSNVVYGQFIAGFDSATRVQDNGEGEGSGEVTTTVVAPGVTTTVFAAAPTTATIYTTSISTVYVYAGSAATAYPNGAVVTNVVPVGTTTYVYNVPTANIAIPTITVYAGAGAGSGYGAAAPTVTVTVDASGNVVGGSGSGAAAGGAAAGAAYPTVTVHDTVTYCPAQETTWTTIYV